MLCSSFNGDRRCWGWVLQGQGRGKARVTFYSPDSERALVLKIITDFDQWMNLTGLL